MKLRGGDWSKGDLIALVSLVATISGLIIAYKSMPPSVAKPPEPSPSPISAPTPKPTPPPLVPKNKYAGTWSGRFADFTEHRLKSDTGCIWDVLLSDINMAVTIDDQGKIGVADVSFNYDEQPLNNCGALTGKSVHLRADLSNSKLTGDTLFLDFPPIQVNYPNFLGTFNGNMKPGVASGKLAIRRTGETRFPRLNEWTFDLPRAELRKSD